MRSTMRLALQCANRSWVARLRAPCRTSILQRCQRRTLVSAADLQFGQPLHETHPHLLKAGEVTPGISALEYAQRRSRLAQALPERSIAILAASDVKYRSGAVFYEYHQDPDFLYLTGFNEPEALAVIEKTGPGDDHIFHLYVRPKDPKAELWEGARSGVQAAQDVFNADEAASINKVSTLLHDLLNQAKQVFTDVPKSFVPSSNLGKYLSGSESSKLSDFPKLVASSNASISALRPLMNKVRIFKSEAEIQNMRRAGKASGRAFTEAMGQKFTTERELWSYLKYRFDAHGCDGWAYIPVVAGGKNALSIHYVRNDDVLKKNDLVLVDAGGEYGGYITDITRTWPVSGKFSPAQRDMYNMILGVQRSCVSLCREDAKMSLDKLHKISENALKDGLKQLGFDMRADALDILFPHHLGHYIGLDVHDSPGFPRKTPLMANQCITIEPAIYVPDDDRWPAHFRGMGIRIEDSVCIKEDSPLILTPEAVKEVVDIEALRA